MAVRDAKSILLFLVLPVVLLIAILSPEMIPGLGWVAVIFCVAFAIMILPLLPVAGALSAVNDAAGGREWVMVLASLPLVAMGIAALYWIVDSVVSFLSSGPKFSTVAIVKWSEAKDEADMALFHNVRLEITGKEKEYKTLHFGRLLARNVAGDLREGTTARFLMWRKDVFAVGLADDLYYHAKDLRAFDSRKSGCFTLFAFLCGGYIVAALATLPFAAAITPTEWGIMQIMAIYCVMCLWFFFGFGKFMTVYEERRREMIRRRILEAYPDTPEAMFALPKEESAASTC